MNKSHDELCQELERIHGDIRLMTQCVRDGHWPELCMMSSDTELDALGDAVNSMRIRYENDLITAKNIVETANEQGRRLAQRLQETSDMLTEALALGEDSSERYRALKESRPEEIADAVMRARREWAAQGRLRPTAVRRTSDMSIELTFHSCRMASEFEELMKPVGGEA